MYSQMKSEQIRSKMDPGKDESRRFLTTLLCLLGLALGLAFLVDVGNSELRIRSDRRRLKNTCTQAPEDPGLNKNQAWGVWVLSALVVIAIAFVIVILCNNINFCSESSGWQVFVKCNIVTWIVIAIACTLGGLYFALASRSGQSSDELSSSDASSDASSEEPRKSDFASNALGGLAFAGLATIVATSCLFGTDEMQELPTDYTGESSYPEIELVVAFALAIVVCLVGCIWSWRVQPPQTKSGGIRETDL